MEITKTLNVQAKFTIETGETSQEISEEADEKIVTTKKTGCVEILNTKVCKNHLESCKNNKFLCVLTRKLSYAERTNSFILLLIG